MNIAAPRRKKNISLTPLIDAVFILLLFFMLSSSFDTQHSFTLQATNTQTSDEAQLSSLIIINPNGSFSHIAAGNNIIEADRATNFAELTTFLQTTHSYVVLPAKTVTVQTIMHLISRLKNNGYSNITLGEALDVGSSNVQ